MRLPPASGMDGAIFGRACRRRLALAQGSCTRAAPRRAVLSQRKTCCGGPRHRQRAMVQRAGRRFDVCNGDADGLCAALQWRLHAGPPERLFTGAKREIELLRQVGAAAGDEVCVFDLSMQRNAPALARLLERGVRVRWFDHHHAGEVPRHALLDARLDRADDTCSSLIVDRALGGAHRAWALVGAYGDNLAFVADPLAQASGFGAVDRAALRRLGEAINYNAYGNDVGELHVAPARLYETMARYADPRGLLAHEPIGDELDALRAQDLARALQLAPHWQGPSAALYLLPDAAWSRRVLGSFANALANAQPARAHAVLAPQAGGGWAASVRAPLSAPVGAHALCSRFGGAGRARAAGIDGLPATELDRFIAALGAMRWGDVPADAFEGAAPGRAGTAPAADPDAPDSTKIHSEPGARPPC